MPDTVVSAVRRPCRHKIGVLILATLLCSLLGAQVLETTLYLPDSLTGVSRPQCLAWDSIDNTVYVGGNSGSRVIAFDAATGAKLAAIPVGEGTRALCWNRTYNRIYAANTSDSTVTVIDCATNTVLAAILCGDGPQALCWNPLRNKVYVANRNSDDVTVISCVTNTVVATVPVGDLPAALVYNSVNDRVYCVAQSDDSVYAINGSTNNLVARIPSGDYPYDICYNATNNRLYVPAFNDDTLIVIDGATNAITAKVPVGERPDAVCWNSAENKVYVANIYGNSVTIINGATNAVIDDSLPTVYMPTKVFYNPTANKVYCSAQYADSVIYPADRYRLLMERNQWAARRIMTFALHLHFGARDGDHAVALINYLVPYMPIFLALSASSPFWQGEDTGLASSRTTLFEALPTAGHPPTYASWKEFEALYEALVTSGSISSVKDLWWDIRPRPEYGTVEMRICDGVPTLSETVALVVLFEALCRHLDGACRAGARPELVPDWRVRENKWRASRYGLEAEVLVDNDGHTAPLRGEVLRWIEKLRPEAAGRGTERSFATLERMTEQGCSYERQRRVFRKAGTLKAVAEALVEEFRTNRPVY